MLIGGIQQHTTIDYPGKLACVVFTVGCNLRCPFCYNPSQVLPKLIAVNRDDLIPEIVFFNFLETRRGLLDGVSICGWEPTLQSDLYHFVKKIKQMWFLVKLDTNGRDGFLVEKMIDEWLLDYVAVDLKQCWWKFDQACGIPLSDSFKENYEHLLDVLKQWKVAYEYRTTVIKWLHSQENIEHMAEFLEGIDHYYLQQFVSSTNLLDPDFDWESYSEEDMKKMQQVAASYVKKCFVRS